MVYGLVCLCALLVLLLLRLRGRCLNTPLLNLSNQLAVALLKLVLLCVEFSAHLLESSNDVGLGILELRLLLLDPPHEHLADFVLATAEFARVLGALLLKCLLNALVTLVQVNLAQTPHAERFVVLLLRRVDQIFHVRPQKHLAEAHKIAVVLIFNLNNAPRVLSHAHTLSSHLDLLPGSNDGKGNKRIQLCVEIRNLIIVLWKAVDRNVIVLNLLQDALLVVGEIRRGDAIGLCNDGNDIDLVCERAHGNKIKRLERVAGGCNKIQARVDPLICNLLAVANCLEFFLEILFEFAVDIVHNWLARVFAVNLIAKANRVDNGKAQADSLLLEIKCGSLDAHFGPPMVRLVRLKVRLEKRIHQSGLAKTRLADAENVELISVLVPMIHELIGKTVEANISIQFKLTVGFAQHAADLCV
eukprot:Opistho-2@5115